jgi:hypothetical protein
MMLAYDSTVSTRQLRDMAAFCDSIALLRVVPINALRPVGHAGIDVVAPMPAYVLQKRVAN